MGDRNKRRRGGISPLTCGVVATALTSVWAGGAAAAPAEPAATSETALQEIVVTARRREERMQDVPITMTALTNDDLRRQSILTTTDLQYHVPGLLLAASSRGMSTPSFSMRGQRQSDASMSTDPAVGVYFSEAPIARPNGLNGSIFDMQSVQVLKGPQGTLFGRNTTGGAVLFTPNSPGPEFAAMAQYTGGNFGLSDFEGMVNLPITDKVMLRIAGKVTRRNGYMTDVTPGSGGHRANDIDNRGVRASLRLEPTSQIRSDFIASYFKADDGGTVERLVAFNAATFPVPALRPTFANLAAKALQDGKYDYEDLPYFLNSGKSQPQYSRVEVSSFQNTTSWEASDNVTIKNIIAYRKTNSTGTFDIGPLPMIIVRTNSVFDAKQFSDEFQIQGHNDGLNWLVGLFYFHEQGPDGAPSNQFTRFETFSSSAFVENASRSVFAHADYTAPWAPRWSIAAGIRYNHDERKTKSEFRSSLNSATTYRCLDNTIVTNSLNGTACPTFTAKATFEKPTYDVTLNYKPNADIMAYISQRRGYRSGVVFSRVFSVAALNTPTSPEVVDETEVGVKSEVGGPDLHARINGSLFRDKYKNAQRLVAFSDPNGVFGSAYINAAEATIEGADLDFSFLIGTQWSIDVGYNYIFPKYGKFFDHSRTGTAIDVSDSDFAYTPKNVLSVTARYQLPLPEEAGKVALQANYYRQSSFVVNEINTTNCGPGGVYLGCLDSPYGRLPGYDLVNLRMDWDRVMNSSASLSLFVNNVADKYYYSAGFNQISSLGFAMAQPAPPRMFGVQLRYEW